MPYYLIYMWDPQKETNKQHQQKTKTQQQLNSQIQRTEAGVEGGWNGRWKVVYNFHLYNKFGNVMYSM